jgi:hypothetical protein
MMGGVLNLVEQAVIVLGENILKCVWCALEAGIVS